MNNTTEKLVDALRACRLVLSSEPGTPQADALDRVNEALDTHDAVERAAQRASWGIT
jgi:hypothetical protein